MIHRRAFLVGVITLLASVGTVSAGRAAEFVAVGSRTVNLGSDHDRITGLLTRLRLEVSGNTTFMQSLMVTFVNGETAELPVRLLIEDGGRPRNILLPGIIRAIQHIDKRYWRVPFGGRATVTIVGHRL